jgi:hypothetical protein
MSPFRKRWVATATNTKLPSGTVLEILRHGLLISRQAPHPCRIKSYVSCTTLGRYAPGRHTRRLPAELFQCNWPIRKVTFFDLPFAASLWCPPTDMGSRWTNRVQSPSLSHRISALHAMARSSFFPISWQSLPTSCQLLSPTVSIASIRRAPVYSFFPCDTIGTALPSRRQGWQRR